MNKLRLYRTDIEYIKYLYSFDNRIQYNPNQTDEYTQKRPYLGIVLEVDNLKYFVPLEHPRVSHQKMKNNVYISECCWGYPESFSTKFCGFRLSLNYQDGSEIKNAFSQADLNHSLFPSRSVRARRLRRKKSECP